MRLRSLFLVSGLTLCGCMKAHRPALVEAEPSLGFPSSFDTRIVVAEGRAYELDGAVLRALSLATTDFLPPTTPSTPCWDRPESHRYRILREQDVIFIRIDEDPGACGRQVPALHSGAKYAIHADGRLLRRILDGEPEQGLKVDPGEDDAGEDAAPGTLPPQDPLHPGGPPPRFLAPSPDGGPHPLPLEPRPPSDGGVGAP